MVPFEALAKKGGLVPCQIEVPSHTIIPVARECPVSLIFNQPQYKRRRQELRQQPSSSEARLWWYLQKRRFLGFKFRRQQGIGPYVVDFYCPKLGFVIEVDGDSHFEPASQIYDKFRQDWVEEYGIRMIRFANDEVLEDTFGVLSKLKTFISEPPHTPP